MKKYQSRKALKSRIAALELDLAKSEQRSAAHGIIDSIVDKAYKDEYKMLRSKIVELKQELAAHEVLNGKITKFEKSLSKKSISQEEKDNRNHQFYKNPKPKLRENIGYTCGIENCVVCK